LACFGALRSGPCGGPESPTAGPPSVPPGRPQPRERRQARGGRRLGRPVRPRSQYHGVSWGAGLWACREAPKASSQPRKSPACTAKRTRAIPPTRPRHSPHMGALRQGHRDVACQCMRPEGHRPRQMTMRARCNLVERTSRVDSACSDRILDSSVRARAAALQMPLAGQGSLSDLRPADGPVSSVSQPRMTCVPYHGYSAVLGAARRADCHTRPGRARALRVLLLCKSCFIRRNIRDIDRSLARLILDRPVSAKPPRSELIRQRCPSPLAPPSLCMPATT
jgi:hypothetical protein